MLCILLFSITPKQYLHRWFANHTDLYSETKADHSSVIPAGFNCGCDDPVVSSPFVQTSAAIEIVLPSFLTIHVVSPLSETTFTATVPVDSRGPPNFA
jgi:hypothetical protein